MVRDNENKGRKVWTCKNKVCNFFQWFDAATVQLSRAINIRLQFSGTLVNVRPVEAPLEPCRSWDERGTARLPV